MDIVKKIEEKFSFLVESKGFDEPRLEFIGVESYLVWENKKTKITASCHNYSFTGFPFFSFEIKKENRIYDFIDELEHIGLETAELYKSYKKSYLSYFIFKIIKRKKKEAEIEKIILDMAKKIEQNYYQLVEKKLIK